MDNNNFKPKSIGGVSFNEQPVQATQPSYQNQSNYGQGGNNSSGGKNKWGILCAVLGVIVAILLIVLVVVIIKKNDSSDDEDKKEKTTTEERTEEDTEEDTEDTEDTEEPTTEDPQPGSTYTYVAPTELSGDWEDFQISINDVCYQFPFPYYVLEQNGWTVSGAPTDIASGETEAVFATSDVGGNDFMFYVTNPQTTLQPIENCFVTSLYIDSDCSGDVVKLAEDIVFGEAVKQDFLNTFGAPDWAFEDGDMEYVSYYTDDWNGTLDLEMDENELCYLIRIENLAMPEGVTVEMDISTEAPDINASYVAPDGPSTELTDNIITIDGYNYKLPCPVSEFTKNGWEIETMTDEYITSNSSIVSALEKDGEKFFCTIINYTDDTIYTHNGMVTLVDVYDGYSDEVDIIFPGDIEVGDNASEFEALYSGYEFYECDKDDEYEDLYYSVTVPLSESGNEAIFIWVDCDYATGEILEYMYEYYNY